MPAPEIIHQLVANFEQNRESYRSGKYNEARLRQQFLDKFFEALGWDVYNRNGYAPENCEVVIEDSLDIEGSSKAPDYTFRMGRERKFFVEAKKPAVDIKYDIHPAYQLRRYAWNAHMPLSILTDFEELAVYNCKSKPDPKDSAATSRDLFFHYTQYIEKWDEIAAIFSRDAVWKGSFDKFAAESKGKKGTTEVDDEILKDIENWRKLLALNLALRNKTLIKDEEQLNYAVQITIDRILFLRICEDRGIEPEEQLKTLAASPAIYPRLVELFRRADTKYNSGLFHLHPEKGETTSADTFTPSLTIDDKVLKEIISDIYYPCPYIFKEIPVEILGQVYEQFLGKVIRLTAGHQAKIEEKPEVRKAGGVYYTPTYIVDYIVANTVGKLLEDKTPEQASAIKIVDPACGSGSFLLGAFKYLLNWHYEYYTTHQPDNMAKRMDSPIFPVNGGWRLTTAEKKRILTNNLHGVDIDPQAVEVTKLSLLLKVLEEESGQLTLGFERVLPDLGRNIQCGNSLIGWDYFEGQLTIDEEERKRVNPFDWQRAFPQVFSQGGFDVVIGNPPYRRELDYGELLAVIAKTPFGKMYKSPRMDLWYYFVHRGLELLKSNGKLSFIVNSFWISGAGAEKLISTLMRDAQVEEIFSLGNLKVFENVTGQHMIFLLSKGHKGQDTRVKLTEKTPELTAETIVTGKSPSINFLKPQNQLFRNGKVDILDSSNSLLNKLDVFPPLVSIGIIRQGIAENPSNINKKTNEKFGSKFTTGEGVFSLAKNELVKMNLPTEEMKLVRNYHDLQDLKRYYLSDNPSHHLIYSTKITCPNINKYPIIRDHLKKFKPIMDERRETKNGSNAWWHLHWPRDEKIWISPKIISIQMASRPSFTLARYPVYVPFSVNVFVPNEDLKEDITYLLGLLNSKLLWQWYKHFAKNRGVGLEINGNVLEKTPIRLIDFSNDSDVRNYKMMVSLVDRMLDLHKRTPATPQEQERLARDIAATDRAIDTLVYQLYDLTPEEIAIVEAS